MTKYFDLAIGDNATPTTPKNVAEGLAGEILKLPPLPIARGHGQEQEEIEITDCEVKPPNDNDLPFYHLRVYAKTWRVGPERIIGEAKQRLVLGGGRDLGVVIDIELREHGPGQVLLVGECDDSMAGFVRLEIKRIKELWPTTREITPEGVERKEALTWADAAQSAALSTREQDTQSQTPRVQREQFNGTPAEFGIMVRIFNRLKPHSDKALFVVTDPPDDKIPPDANPVSIKFGCFPNADYYDYGWIVAQSLPGGKSELTAGAWAENGWPNLEPLWNMLCGEMRRQGRLDAQPAQAGSTPVRTEALARLRQQLLDSFSEEELKTVSLDLGIDYESLPAQGKAGKARELVTQCERTGKIRELVAQCHKLRPNVSWE